MNSTYVAQILSKPKPIKTKLTHNLKDKRRRQSFRFQTNTKQTLQEATPNLRVIDEGRPNDDEFVSEVEVAETLNPQSLEHVRPLFSVASF